MRLWTLTLAGLLSGATIAACVKVSAGPAPMAALSPPADCAPWETTRRIIVDQWGGAFAGYDNGDAVYRLRNGDKIATELVDGYVCVKWAKPDPSI